MVPSPARDIRPLLHPRGRYGHGWTCDSHARIWIDYGDRISGSEGRRLVKFGRVIVVVVVRLKTGGRMVGAVRGRREREGGSDLLSRLELVLKWG